MLLVAPALAVGAWYAAGPQGSSVGRDALETAGIFLGGPMTAAPLIWFAIAARRRPYSVVGEMNCRKPTTE